MTRCQGVVVVDDHILLIQHREHVGGRSFWLLPGGGQEADESEETCVVREMKEETGLDVKVERLLMTVPRHPEGQHRERKTYLCTILAGVAQPGYDPEPEARARYRIAAVGWYDLSSEQDWGADILADTRTYTELKRIQALLGYSQADENPQDPSPAAKAALQMPGVGVATIIHRGNQVLLLRRKNVHGAGSWSTPGGHLEFQEAPEVCAIRETKEETGLDIQEPKFVAITHDVFQAENKHYITIWMMADYQGGEAIVNAPYESDAIGWFDWDHLPQPLFLPLHHLLDGMSYPPGVQVR